MMKIYLCIIKNLGTFTLEIKDCRQGVKMCIKQGQALKKWVEGLSDKAFYPWESQKKIRLKSVNPTFATEQKKVSIHR